MGCMEGDGEVVDVDVIDAAYATNLLDSRALPDLATWLVALGRSSESLVALAGLDMGPYDPRSARELWGAARAELGRSEASWLDRLLTSASLVAQAWRRGEVEDRRAWQLMVHVGVEATTLWHEEQQPELDDVLRCYWLNDEFVGWGQSDQELRRAGFASSGALAERPPELRPDLVTAVVRMCRA
jgi:hypothetical protein